MGKFIENASPYVDLEARWDDQISLLFEDELEKGLFKETKFEVYRISKNIDGSRSSEILVGSFYFTPLPGCTSVIVSTHSNLTERTRGTGLSDPFRKLKENLAKALGAPMMIATVDMNNFPGVGNMFKSKYKMITTFNNPHTENLVGLGIKKL